MPPAADSPLTIGTSWPPSASARIAAQRSSIAALQAQLAAFDEQLAALEGMVGPLAEWSKTWAQFERLVLKPRRDRGPEG
jgi:hypothetical protein